jgi:filamentous hemagglutinin family protein
MIRRIESTILPLFIITTIYTLASEGLQAQPIPAKDDVRTVVTSPALNPNQFDIKGGKVAGSNLFHSLQQLGLSQNQIANFLSTPDTQNILVRVVGGNASVIDGWLSVRGSNANLFLMNPSGILFGPNAKLSIPSAFTATTANAIGVGNGWFNSIGTNNYKILTGTPNNFAFLGNPGSIVNSGNLIANPGKALTLLGGAVVNTGVIASEGGRIEIASVPGENLVRVTQEGSLLSLVLPTEMRQLINSPTNSAISLPTLLTGGNIPEAKGISVENGIVKLIGSEVQAGDVAVAGQIFGGEVTLSGSRNLTLVENQIKTTGNLNLLANDTVRVRDSATVPVLLLTSRDLNIQGSLSIDILANKYFKASPPQFQASLFQSSGVTRLRSGGDVLADGYFINGSFSVQDLASGVGNFSSRNQSGSTIFSESDVTFGNYAGGTLWIKAEGSITGGDIAITSINPNIRNFPTPQADPNTEQTAFAQKPLINNNPAIVISTLSDITTIGKPLANIQLNKIENSTGKVIDVKGRGNIQINSILSYGSTVNICSFQCINFNQPITVVAEKGTITLLGNIDTGIGGKISLTAPGKITTQNLSAFYDPSRIGIGNFQVGTTTLISNTKSAN